MEKLALEAAQRTREYEGTMELLYAKTSQDKRISQLRSAYADEIAIKQQMVEEKKLPEDDYYAWLTAREDQFGKESRRIELERQKDSAAWLADRVVQMQEEGATQLEIQGEIVDSHKRSMTTVEEGWTTGLESIRVAQQDWADASYNAVTTFAQSASDSLSTMFFDMAEGKFTSLADYASQITGTLLQAMIRQLVQMATTWLISMIPIGVQQSQTLVKLGAESVAVGALTTQYTALAIAKTAAAVAGMAGGGPVGGAASGGKLPGYGGGDRVPLMVEAGEFVTRKEAVRHYGQGLFSALNRMQLPAERVKSYGRAQEGGLVTPAAQGETTSGAGERQITVLNVFDQNQLDHYYASKRYGDAVVSRVGEDIVRRMG